MPGVIPRRSNSGVSNEGSDRVIDFNRDEDMFSMRGAGVTSFSDFTITDDGTHSTVTFAGTTILVENVVGSDATDFWY